MSITQKGMKDQSNRAAEVEVGVLMAECAPSLSDKDSLNESQPISTKQT